MAFDFLGQFSKGDIESLRAYLIGEMNKVNAMINHLILESNKIQLNLSRIIEYARNKQIPLSSFGMLFVNNFRSQTDDSDSATLVQQIKKPFYQNIKFRERMEYRAKKALDAIEQLQERIQFLRITKNELESDFEKVNSLFDIQHKHLTVEEDVTSAI